MSDHEIVNFMKDRVLVDDTKTLTLANTEYTISIPAGAMSIALRLKDTTAGTFQVSATTGRVAGGDGFPIGIGQSFEEQGPLQATTLYVASSTAGAIVKYAYRKRLN